MTRIQSAAALVLAATIAVGAGAQQADQVPEDRNPVVMTINGQEVWAAEISLMMRNIEGFLRSQGKEVKLEEVLEVASQRIVEQKLLAQEARRFGITADEARVQQMIQLTEKQAGGRDNLTTALGSGGSSIEQLENTFRDMELGRTFIAQRIRPTIEVTDDEIAQFYAGHPDLFTRKEEVHARHILFKVAEDADAEADATAREKAEAARQRALAGEDFAELAKELSEGPTGPKGGDLGFFPRDAMVQPFADTVFALSPGEISEVVKTQFGYHVIKVDERRGPGVIPLDEAKDQARSVILNQKTTSTVGELLQTLHDKAEIKVLDEGGMLTEVPAGAGNSGG